jgi:hypothetical protein
MQEEVRAYQYQDRIEEYLYGGPIDHAFDALNPNIGGDLKQAQDILGGSNNRLYGSLTLFPASNRWEDLAYASFMILNWVIP